METRSTSWGRTHHTAQHHHHQQQQQQPKQQQQRQQHHDDHHQQQQQWKRKYETVVNSLHRHALVLAGFFPIGEWRLKTVLPPPPAPKPTRRGPPSWRWLVTLVAISRTVPWTLAIAGQEKPNMDTAVWHWHDGHQTTASADAMRGLGGMENVWHWPDGHKQPASADARRGLGGDTSATSSNGRVAVCFFGLARSLRWTVPSIERRVFNVLRESGLEVDVFVHTYSLREVNNERAGERGIQYAPFTNDYRILNMTRALMTNQDDLDMAVPNPISLTQYRWVYPPNMAPGVIRNVFRAYWSQAMVWSLMSEYAAEEGMTYDAVVLARPDVWFHANIDLPTRTFPLPKAAVFIPSFDTDVEVGGQKNDRFAYGSMAAMKVYMNRIDTFTDPDASQYAPSHLNSEWLLGHHLMLHNVSVNTVDLTMTRIRLTGDIPQPDFARLLKVCHSGLDPIACEMVRLGYKFPVGDVVLPDNAKPGGRV